MAAVADLAASERSVTVALIAHLGELDARKLHLGAGYPSLFVYCVRVLHLSEGGAYNRIKAARVARRFPAVLHFLERGLLNLGTLRRLAPHLTFENHEALLEGAFGKSKREVEAMLARLFPSPDVVASIRKLPARKLPVSSALPESAGSEPAAVFLGESATPNGGTPAEPDLARSCGASSAAGPDARTRPAPPPRPVPEPRHPPMTALSPDRYQIRFTASGSTCEKLRRAQELLRHAVPDGDPAEIVDRALTALLAGLERKKFATTPRPSAGRDTARKAAPGSRAIPAAVKRSVTVRDNACCAFVAGSGRRCGERAFLEFHHVVPFARGGPATVENMELRCRAHNGYEADRYFAADAGTGAGARDHGEDRDAAFSICLERHQLVPGRVGAEEGRVG